MEAELIAQPLLPSELPADPVAWCRAFADRPGLALFDSALKARAARPLLLSWHRSVRATRSRPRRRAPERRRHRGAIRSTWSARCAQRYRVERAPDLPPFQTGLAGYFGYGLRHHVERVPTHARADLAWPDLILGLYDLVLAVDHVEGRAWLLASGYPETTPQARRERAEARIGWARERLRQAPQTSPAPSWAIAAKPDLAPVGVRACRAPHHRLHRGRRHLSGQHHPALPRQAAGGLRPAVALPGAAHAQSGDLRRLSRFRRDRHPLVIAGAVPEARATARSKRGRSRARARAAAAPPRTRRWRPSCWPAPRIARKT